MGITIQSGNAHQGLIQEGCCGGLPCPSRSAGRGLLGEHPLFLLPQGLWQEWRCSLGRASRGVQARDRPSDPSSPCEPRAEGLPIWPPAVDCLAPGYGERAPPTPQESGWRAAQKILQEDFSNCHDFLSTHGSTKLFLPQASHESFRDVINR